jgi:uncharacterized membrane protein
VFYRLLIGLFIIVYLSSVMPTLNISKSNNMSSSLFIAKAKQKNTLTNKIQQTGIKMPSYS